MGGYLVGDEARHVFARQGLRGSLVITTSVNAVVAKKGSLAYDASKAAANHLVRGLAVELSPLVRVNALAPATVVAGSTMFPRDRVIASLVKYSIPFEESEKDESLRDKLANYYAQRTLTKAAITPEDQAETAYSCSRTARPNHRPDNTSRRRLAGGLRSLSARREPWRNSMGPDRRSGTPRRRDLQFFRPAIAPGS